MKASPNAFRNSPSALSASTASIRLTGSIGPVGAVGLLVERTRVGLVPDPVEPGDDLRRHVEVGVGGGLADAVLDVGGLVARPADDPDGGPPVLERPRRPVRGEGVGLEPLVAVDRRRGEHARPVDVGEHAAGELAAQGGDRLLVVVTVGERVLSAVDRAQRLMKMPAAREEVGQRRPAHERGVIAEPPAHLLGRRPEQEHVVGRGQTQGRVEGELALPRAPLVLHRPQRKANGVEVLGEHLEDVVDLVVAVLGEVLEAVGDHAHLGRFRRPAGLLGGEPGVLELGDVELDLEPGDVLVALGRQVGERVAHDLPRRERHG